MAKRKTQTSTDTQVSAAAETTTTVTVPVASEPIPETSVVQPVSDDSLALSSQPEGGAYSRFSDFDIYLFRSGKHSRLYEKFGSHVIEHQGVVGTYFAVWAPSAKYVAVIGNFNGWNKGAHPMGVRWDGSGIWEIFIPHIGRGEVYKYFIVHESGRELEKGDPYAHTWEVPPLTASVVWDNWHEWTDQEWMQTRQAKNALTAPFSVYEVHLSSWRRDPSDPERELSYGEIADALVPYVQDMGFTHVEFMPVMQYPYAPSWGYQITGYFAPSSKFGKPQDFMTLVERLHNAGIGVILDWVPSHFPGDAHGLFEFDGSHLYEHPDMRKGYHPDWKSYIFNYGRPEVRSFLISNALYWLDRYHVDGLRVDAVASMLYLDYSRNHGEWEPNIFGGRENLEVISLFRELNETIYREFPDVQTIAEESTAFPGVSRPVYTGGLGFGMKWMMGWMNDSLRYFQRDPGYRKYHQDEFTFSAVYAFTENFMLPLSHDEVVYGKKSLINKMPGDEWQRFANLRLLFAYMFTHPGTKLVFMGGEFGQLREWKYDISLDWHLLNEPSHQGIAACVKALNHLYRSEPALHERNFQADGFEWIDTADRENTIISYMRKGENPADNVVIVLNMTPIPRFNYRIGAPAAGTYEEIFNSDNVGYYGSGVGNAAPIVAENQAWQGREYSMEITLPPLAAVVFKSTQTP
ncbi:1,4-alpha-glucan branching protein GlgB [Arsenicibacter rosenii]|uniref:1,4-alpha-glucan branching enzyme GlgB n=1 Tax=Arsenicibacter rosenii TaxID=1750698 RepID=A0A1S2VL25_9BACT|nr:1,4-alpha-glucan branching protein GlgB [Arsenicibacter rosenii]OIN59464.1 1,4-alpha-glucan branching enzyme [Arsenicibacter rosenii]